MSFPRAKITRFNENVPCTPSPAEYNVALKNNPTGAKISKSERFAEGKTPSTSENGSIASAPPTPVFRTPTLPKRKKGIFVSPSVRSKYLELPSRTDVSEEQLAELEALKDKTVECNNKDLYIKDLMEQIEEIREKLVLLEQQKLELIDEKNKCDVVMRELQDGHNNELQSIHTMHEREVNSLKEQLKKSEDELKVVKEEFCLLDKKIRDSEKRLAEEVDNYKVLLTKSLEDVKEELKKKQDAISEKVVVRTELEERLRKAERMHEEEIEALKETHKTEMADMEFALLENVSRMQSSIDKCEADFKKHIAEMEKKHEEEKNIILTETNARIKQVEEDSKEANVLAEMLMSEKCRDVQLTWEIKLEEQQKQANEILKECQEISEYNIIQCELEKNKIKTEMFDKVAELRETQKENADLSIARRELEMKYEDLQATLSETKATLQETKRRHLEENEIAEKELHAALNQKKLYEISIHKSHETIETLKKRLLDSDHDVEQLKAELEVCEKSKLECQVKCDLLAEELEVALKANSDLELGYEATVKDTEERIRILEQRLCDKVEEYNETARSEIATVKAALEAKERDLCDVMTQLHEQQALNTQAQSVIADAERKLEKLDVQAEILSEHNFVLKLKEALVENAKLRKNLVDETNRVAKMDVVVKQVVQLQEKSDTYSQYCDYYKLKAAEYETEIEELQGVNKKYIEQSGKYDDLLQKCDALEKQNAALERMIAEQQSLIGPFREQLEAYEMENNALVNLKSQAESEARNIALKYAHLLGHQNQKQKIKHMIDLKDKNLELMECKKDLELKLRAQTRTIEKLKKELTNTPRKSKKGPSDKENVDSPNKTLNGSRVESPCPLRDRN